VSVAKEIELERQVREHGRADGEARSPPRPPTWPATAPPPPPCWPRPSSARVMKSGRRRFIEPDGSSSAASTRRWLDGRRAQEVFSKPVQPTTRRSPRSAPFPPTQTTVIGKMIADAMKKVGKEGVDHRRGSPQEPETTNWTSSKACSSTAAISPPTSSTEKDSMERGAGRRRTSCCTRRKLSNVK
jgi:hypothetical protein